MEGIEKKIKYQVAMTIIQIRQYSVLIRIKTIKTVGLQKFWKVETTLFSGRFILRLR